MIEKYISLQEVADELRVARGTLHYYLEQLKIEPTKFKLDRRKYILLTDFERIQTLRRQAIERNAPAVDKDAA